MARGTRWQGWSVQEALTGVDHLFDVIISDADDLMQRGLTITRIRAMLLWKSDVVSGNVLRGAFGIILTQAGTTIAGMPDPAIDFDADWIYHTGLIMFGDDDATAGRAKVVVDIDNRSQRKLADHKQLVAVYSSLSTLNTVMGITGRGLFLLP